MFDDAFYKHLLDNLSDGVYFVDRERRITYWNRGAERITGYGAHEVVGHYCWQNILQHVTGNGCQLCWGLCPLAATLRDGRQREAQVYLHHKDGYRVPVHVRVSPIRDASGAVVGAVETFSDSTAVAALEEEVVHLRQLALLDALTEVGNRRYLDIQLAARVEECRRYGWQAGVLMIDVDRFKAINDGLGHATGDAVLRMVARTLQHNIRACDVVGRWGGEEFLVLMRAPSAAELHALAERLRALVAQSTIEHDGQTVRVTISIGMTLARPDDTPAALLARVDELMYRAKQAGRDRVVTDIEGARVKPLPAPIGLT